MTPNVRIYETEKGAKDAVTRLEKAGFDDIKVFLAGDSEGKEAETVRSAVSDGIIPERKVLICTRSLKEGRSLVAVNAPFGKAQEAIKIMEAKGTVYSDLLRRYVPSSAAPLSNGLGLPVLSDFVSSTGLLRQDWNLSEKFGMPLLSKNQRGSDRSFGMKTLSTPKKEWKSSFGMPLLSKNPAPLSSLFGMKTLTKPKPPQDRHHGIPVLSKNPAPLSSFLGMKTLIRGR